MTDTPKRLRFIFGDQLSRNLASLQDINLETDLVLMCEVADETHHVKHHKKKIAFLFSAMRHFAEALRREGITVRYIKLNDADNAGSFTEELKRACAEHSVDEIVVTEPGEYRIWEFVNTWAYDLGLPVTVLHDERFLCTHQEFANWADGRKQLRMEFFYREMRKKYSVLMDGAEPVGGQWTYDAENRKPPAQWLLVPEPFSLEPDEISREVLSLVEEQFAGHFGDLEPFYFAVTREQALDALALFIETRLPMFGDYQDAMIQGEPWMYHSHISFYLNCGLLVPLGCVEAAEAAYEAGKVPLNAAEGFIRQIMGWREFVRGIYWLKMPEYKSLNFFEATRKLPDFYWTANTQMNCLRQCVLETRQNAYAHHIQRLMVLGNFALIAGIHPEEVNEWFLIVYADAFEWVELPNVSGMILFADGGYLASKPYAAGGNYINKMSNYCKSCSYSPAKKNGPKACPFNYLYWNFLATNRDTLQSNSRVSMIYRTYDRMDEEKKQAIRQDSAGFLESLS